MSTLILRIALPLPLTRLFDYLSPIEVDPNILKPGIRLRVPFGKREIIGILVETTTTSQVPLTQLKQAISLLDTTPLFSHDLYQLCLWAAQYYHFSLGLLLSSVLPRHLRLGKTAKAATINKHLANLCNPQPAMQRFHDIASSAPHLNPAQQEAINAINAKKNEFCTFLLYGITGSGKTEVYLHVIKRVLEEGQQALVLVPEINLTPQIEQRFRARFPVPIATIHSGLSENERLAIWLGSQSGAIKIIIGTRSAIFTPFACLGLIIMDEEHDGSFKQQDRCHYHARDLSIIRARFNKHHIVLGSATPSSESWQNVQCHRYILLRLTERAGKAIVPSYQFLDLNLTPIKQAISIRLIEMMQSHLQAGNQVLLFLNRRGFAPILYCYLCHWIAQCETCQTRLVYHQKAACLKCHYCGAHYPFPQTCSRCKQASIRPIGAGTERLEKILKPLFKDVPIIRIDRDSTQKKGEIFRLLESVHQHPSAILIGTQMLAKGHHFPNVTLIGIINADQGLFSADFRAIEQLGQLLCQVAGRAGRAEKPGTVLIQTHYPQHPYLNILVKEGYLAFLKQLLLERKPVQLPPYAYLVVLRAEARIKSKLIDFIEKIKKIPRPATILLYGPLARFPEKYKQQHRLQLLFKASSRKTLHHFLSQYFSTIEQLGRQAAIKWAIDIDPLDLF